jgi:hypothetical protein
MRSRSLSTRPRRTTRVTPPHPALSFIRVVFFAPIAPLLGTARTRTLARAATSGAVPSSNACAVTSISSSRPSACHPGCSAAHPTWNVSAVGLPVASKSCRYGSPASSSPAVALSRARSLSSSVSSNSGPPRQRRRCSSSLAALLSPPPSCSPRSARSTAARATRNSHDTPLAPLEASSGRVQRHRLDRGGNRQLNVALYRIAITQDRYHPQLPRLSRTHPRADERAAPPGGLLRQMLVDRLRRPSRPRPQPNAPALPTSVGHNQSLNQGRGRMAQPCTLAPFATARILQYA